MRIVLALLFIFCAFLGEIAAQNAQDDGCVEANFNAFPGSFELPAEPELMIQVDDDVRILISVHLPVSNAKSSAFYLDFASDNQYSEKNPFNESLASFPFASQGTLNISQWTESHNEWKSEILADCKGIVLSRNFSTEDFERLKKRGEMNWNTTETSLLFNGKLFISWIATSPFDSLAYLKVASWEREFQVEVSREIRAIGSAPIGANFDSTIEIPKQAEEGSSVTITQTIRFGEPYSVSFYNVILCHGIKEGENCSASSQAIHLVKNGVLSEGVSLKSKKSSTKIELTFNAPGTAEKGKETDYIIEVNSKLNYNDKTTADSVDILAKGNIKIEPKAIGDSTYVLKGLTPTTASVLVGVLVIFVQFNPTSSNSGGHKKGLRFGSKGVTAQSLAAQGQFSNAMVQNLEGKAAALRSEPAGSFASSTLSDSDYRPGYK
eukprot:TRINITY_DN8153_c0_g1_i1.p1 TRINITY_DN8153_c0_g1~~TRINITY_DN8153_c0_g1_i1.p1  ORF type:complete len:436 (-),score=129.09 TRINITY_DN8153_c0_g1_i1:29-1336(-)